MPKIPPLALTRSVGMTTKDIFRWTFRPLFLACILLHPVFTTFPATAQQTNLPVVLELFTSQGCADTPAADGLATNLVSDKDKNVTVLTCHLSLMDIGGWKDTLANKDCDSRRRRYAKALKIPTAQVPQFVINGAYDTIGQNNKDVYDLIDKARSTDYIGSIGLKLGADTLDIALPEKEKFEKTAEIWLFAFDREHVVDINAGQNAGSCIKYVNVVKHIVKVMYWKGPATNYTMDLKLVPGDGYTVIAQEIGQGKILAASTVIREEKVLINSNP